MSVSAEAPRSPERSLVLTVPDWSAVAAAAERELGAMVPVAVLHAGGVVVANAAARSAGITIGIKKRTAHLRCPETVLVPWDPEIDNKHFSAGVSALEDLVARFTLLNPGTVAIPLNSLKHGYADEASAVEAVISALVSATGWEFYPGIADTVFAAVLASSQAIRVEPGRTEEFLAVQSVSALEYADPDYAELVEVFLRLGLRTLGDLASLGPRELASRFGALGHRAHGLATGRGRTYLHEHVRAGKLCADMEVDPAEARSDALGFLARRLAVELLEKVRRQGLVCTYVTITLIAVGGRESQRTWRIADMAENSIADRLRWQYEGWLSSAQNPLTATDAPDPEEFGEEGITHIGLFAAELSTALEAAGDLFSENLGQVSRTLERVQGLFGPDSVLVPGVQGGWDPSETNLWTPWQQASAPVRDPQAPWPGALAAPRPAVVDRLAVDLLGEDGETVGARPVGLGSAPRRLRFPSGDVETVVSHSDSWPIESGWWSPGSETYRTRLQLVMESGRAVLVSRENGQWYLTGWYR